MNKGSLYLVPSVISDCPVETVIPSGTLEIVRRLEHFITEEIRTARRFLRKAGHAGDFAQITFHEFNEHSGTPDFETYLGVTREGKDVGLLSEAGVPCVADPGSEIVRLAHENGISVRPLTGPSSILLSLMGSGFNGQNFTFHGYLPVDRNLRNRKLKEIERYARDQRQTQIFMETPYRNNQLFKAILDTCHDDTRIGIASDLTGPSEKIHVYPVGEWKTMNIGLDKTPAVFLLYCT